MNNIIWLASYPKSGNTWFRVFLTNLLLDSDEPADINHLDGAYPANLASSRMVFDELTGINSSDLSHDEVDSLRPAVYRFLSGQSDDTMYMKIHDAYTFTAERVPLVPADVTRGVIYFIRNPLDVAISFANHSDIDVDESIRRMNDESHGLCSSPGRLYNQLRQRLLSWGDHVRSWLEASELELHIVKYEDMKRIPLETFTAAIQFAGLDKSVEQVQKALRFSSIDILRAQERKNGFKEKSPDTKQFFFKGESGYWREILTPKQADTIINAHRDIMERFGYLDPSGRVL